jgi:hypothetical protein
MSAALLGDLKKDFGGLPLDGKRQPAVDPKGWWLHSKGHDLKSPTAGYFNFHLDQYGGGTPGHIIHEVIGGNKGTPCLDPAWQRLGPR